MRPLSTYLVLLAILHALIHSGFAQSELLEQLRVKVSETEMRVTNLRVDGTSQHDSWDATAKAWKYSGESEATAWYGGLPGSKARVDYHRDVSTTVGGPAPFYEESFTVAYNGRINQKLYKSEGPPDQQHEVGRGVLDSKRDDEIVTGGFASGWNYSIYGCLDNRGMRLSNVFDSKDFVVQAKEKSYSGVNCIQLTATARREPIERTWYLDPTRGYAILGCELAFVKTNRVVFSRITVQKLLEPSPGIYYPGKVLEEVTNPDGTPSSRSTYEASTVIVNDPTFAEDVFNIEWPKGTLVYDRINDKKFIVEGDTNTIMQSIDHQVEQVRSQIADQRTLVQAQTEQTATKTIPVARRAWPCPQKRLIVVVILLAVILAAGVAVSLRRK
jgi:hypothetical protein